MNCTNTATFFFLHSGIGYSRTENAKGKGIVFFTFEARRLESVLVVTSLHFKIDPYQQALSKTHHFGLPTEFKVELKDGSLRFNECFVHNE